MTRKLRSRKTNIEDFTLPHNFDSWATLPEDWPDHAGGGHQENETKSVAPYGDMGEQHGTLNMIWNLGIPEGPRVVLGRLSLSPSNECNKCNNNMSIGSVAMNSNATGS
ncbi:MAG: hypothetical protein FRX48_06248 [Lasallia pustulata]|uniref:Uncharacterized protein n=1 Tax=Lasallia pustulata TaxID=136370 RepID=A0A5M8PLL2_9LECA|nr:MAG: hypothetical protein FRX48_06248 [Lasallia pustulata]